MVMSGGGCCVFVIVQECTHSYLDRELVPGQGRAGQGRAGQGAGWPADHCTTG